VELAQHKDIEELTEDGFYRMVGDFFSVHDRLKEIQRYFTEFEKGRDKLPSHKAYDSFGEYLSVKRLYDSYDELAKPVMDRLKAEQADKKKHKWELAEQLASFLPEGVWFRYGDRAIRNTRETKYGQKRQWPAISHGIYDRKLYEYSGLGPCDWLELQEAPWVKIAPIERMVKREQKPIPRGKREKVAPSGVGVVTMSLVSSSLVVGGLIWLGT
jgi:hypothetical protein